MRMVLGVCVHGLSGDAMVEKTGYYSLMAEDILDGIKRGIKMKTEQDYQRVYAGINLDAVMHNLEKDAYINKR